MALTTIRKEKRHKRNVEYNDDVLWSMDNNPGQVAGERAEQEEKVHQMLSVLKPEERACVVLRFCEGLSYAEISQALKVNINTVRTRLRRARLALQARFAKKDGGDE